MVWLQCNGAKGLLILRNVLSEDVPKRLGLLRAEIDALQVLDGYGIGCVLMHEAKRQEEIPDAQAHLHAIGGGIAFLPEWVIRWCERGDLTPRGFPHQILRLVRLPIPPLSLLMHIADSITT